MKKKGLLSAIISLSILGCVAGGTKNALAAGTAADVIRIASGEIGYHEKVSNASLDDKTANSGSANFNKYARDIGVANGQPWCASFIWWCMQSAGVDAGNYPRVTYATRDWFKSRGQWHDRGTYTPKPGDYVAFGTHPDHCGIVWTVNGSGFTTIEGNTSDQVASHSYNFSNTYIMGYGEIHYSGNPVVTDNPGAPYAVPSGNIGKGSSGDGTRWIQTALNKLIGAGLTVDGIFGDGTKNAVIKFQSANGLSADGIVGNGTRSKMIEVWKAKQDTTKPSIKNVRISEKTSTYYVVECDVSDNKGVTKVQFPTWTSKKVNGKDQDDLKWVDASVKNGHASARINIADHNNETGPYITHVYAWDAAGNAGFADAGVIALPQVTDGTKQDLGEQLTAQITFPGGKALAANGDTVAVKTASAADKTQQWRFVKNKDGSYQVQNLGNAKNLDVFGAADADGTKIQTYVPNGTAAQNWSVYKTSAGSYYLVPGSSKLRVLDIGGSGGTVHLWSFSSNANQLAGIQAAEEKTQEPLATVIPEDIQQFGQPGTEIVMTEETETTIQPEEEIQPEPELEVQPEESTQPEPELEVQPEESTQPEPEPEAQPEKSTQSEAEDARSETEELVSPVQQRQMEPEEAEMADRTGTEANKGGSSAAAVKSSQSKPAVTSEPVKSAQPAKTEVPGMINNAVSTLQPVAADTGISSKSLENVRAIRKRKTVTVRWSWLADADGYQVQYAKNRSFSWGANNKMTSANQIRLRLARKIYYVRVRAYQVENGKAVYGEWSKKIRVRR